MKIAMLGAGAMGSLFGAYLSQQHDVTLVDVNRARVDYLNANGVAVTEPANAGVRVFRPKAVCSTAGMGPADLVVVFVKAMFTEAALSDNRGLIGPDTYLLSMQNGAGHEAKLLAFAGRERAVLGTTQHNSSILPDGGVNHGGCGQTFLGLLEGGGSKLQFLADAFTDCGIQTQTSDCIRAKVWEKLFLNTAASSLTAVLQAPLGFIADNPHACLLMERLAAEAVAVANAETNAGFEAGKVIADITRVLQNSRGGYTSIYADLKNGRLTEVDTISGAVVAAARRWGVAVPVHEAVVAMIHAMEARNQAQPQT